MKKGKIIGLLLLSAFIFTTGFNGLAFGAKKGFIPPAWSQILPASERFELVMNDEAVLDKETGLVWERSPDLTTMNWYSALYASYNKIVGGRGGWRLPTVEELMSLVDRTQGPPTLPAGHPFQNVQSYRYWSANSDAETGYARHVNFASGWAGAGIKQSAVAIVWCVRGGHGYDGGHEPNP